LLLSFSVDVVSEDGRLGFLKGPLGPDLRGVARNCSKESM